MPFDPNAFMAASTGQQYGAPAAPAQPRQSSFGAEASSAWRNYIATFGHIAGALGVDSAREWARDQEAKANEASARSTWTQDWRDVDMGSPSSIASFIGHLGMQSLPYAAEAVAAALSMGGTAVATGAARAGLRLAGREATEAAVQAGGRTAAAVAGSYPSSVGTILSAQQEQAGQYGLGSAAALGVPYAALNAGGIEGSLARRAMPSVEATSRLARGLGTGLRVGASEGLQEVGQQVMEEGGRAAVDPSHSLLGEAAQRRYVDAAVGGALLGGTMGGARGLASSRPETAPAPPPPAPVSTPEPVNLLTGGQPTQAAPSALPITAPGGSLLNPSDQGELFSQYQSQRQPGVQGDLFGGALPQAQPDPYAARQPELPFDQPVPTTGPEAMARAAPGETLDMFGAQPSMPRQGSSTPQPQDQLRLRQQIEEELDRREAAQPDLFERRPTSTVNTDYSLRHIRQRILAATNGRQDAYALQVSTQLARMLSEGKDAEAARFLAGEQTKLEGAKVTPATIEHRLRVLVAAERAVGDFASRMDDARRQETAQLVEEAKGKAKPGAVVDTAPVDDRAASVAAVREQAATKTQEAPAPAAQPKAPQVNTPEDIDAVVANEAAERSRKERGDILQAVLDDPTTMSPVGRFRAALRKAGFKTTALTEDEANRIERFEQIKNAVAPAEDRSGVEALEAQIKERTAPSAQQPKERAPQAKAPRLNLLGNSDLDMTPEARPEPAPTPDTGTISDPAQRSMFVNATRRLIKVPTGEPAPARQPRAKAEKPTPPTPAPAAPQPAAASSQPAAPVAPAAPEALAQRIHDTVVSKWGYAKSVRLEDLRDVMADVPRKDLDAELVRLAGSGQITLMPVDYRDDRHTARTDAAALKIGEFRRDLIWIDHPASKMPAAPVAQQGTLRLAQPAPTAAPKPSPMQAAMEKAQAEKAQAEAAKAKADAEAAQAQAQVAKAAAAAVAPPTPAQVKIARRAMRDRVEVAAKAGLVSAEEAQQAYRLVTSEDPQAIRMVQAMLNERVAQRRGATQPAPTPAPVAPAPGPVIAPEDVKARLLRERGLTAGTPSLANEITQAQTRGDITRQQAANVRETMKADGQDAARQQLQDYMASRATVYRPGTARSASAPQEDRVAATAPVAEPEGPSELDFEARPRTAAGTTGMPASDVLSVVNERIKGWRNAPKIRIAQSENDLPPGLWDARRSPNGVTGLYDPQTGTVYLVADRINSTEEAAATLYHEALGHYGIEAEFGNRATEMLSSIYRTNREMRQLADGYLTQNPNVYRGEDATAKAVEEVLARAAEQGQPIPQSVMQRLVAMVKQFARRMGLYNGDYSNAEVAHIFNRAMQRVTDGTPPTNGGVRNEAMPRTATNIAGSEGIKSLMSARTSMVMDVKGVGRRLRLSSLFQRNLEELYGKLFPKGTLRTYNDLLFRMAAKVNHLSSEAHTMLDRWNRLEASPTQSAAEVQKEMGDLLLDATFYQMRPDLPITDEVNADARGDDAVKRHEEMAKRYAALPQPARLLYTEMFDKFADNLKQKKELFKAQIEAAEGLTEDAKKQSLREIDAMFSRVKVYFPLQRFGKFIVIGRTEPYAEAEERVREAQENLDALDGTDKGALDHGRAALAVAKKGLEKAEVEGGYVVQAYESEGKASLAARQMREEGLRVSQRLADQYQPEVDGVSARFLEQIKGALDTEGRKSDEAWQTAEALKNLFTQAYFQSLPESSALKRQLKRKFVAGYSDDAKRNFAAAMQRDAHYLARLEFGQQSRNVLEELGREAKTSDEVQQDKDPSRPMLAQEVAQEVKKRHAASLRYVDTPVQDKLANMGYLWFLGFTPSFMALNLLQTPLVTLPMIAARHGVTRSGAALTAAASEVGRAQVSAWRKDGAFGEIDINTLSVTDDERAMLRQLLDSGIIDLTQEHDLGTVANGGSTKWRAMMRVASFLPHYTEKVNRLATALAAYRLAVQEKASNPGSRLDPVRYAEKMVADSHFDYSAENAPRWMRPGSFPMAKVLFQFRKYQLAMGYAVVNNFAQAIKSADPEERRLARRTFAGLLMTHGLAAGSLGLPGVALAMGAANLLNGLFGDDDEPWEAQAAYRNFLVDVLGGLTGDEELAKQMGEVVARGALRAPGVRDVLPGDISGRVGLGDVLTPVRMQKSDAEGRAWWANLVVAALGPTASIGGNMAEAVRFWGQGDVAKGLEQALPKAARDLVRAYRFGTEGVTTGRGNPTMGADGISANELVAQAMGFTPSRIIEQYEGRAAIEGAKSALTDRRQLLLRQYSQAVIAGDHGAVEDARAAIQQFNTVRREAGQPLLQIKAQDMLRSAQEHRRYERDLVQGARLRRQERPLGEYGRFANTAP